MNVTTCGIDLAKNLFQVHGVDRRGKPVVKRQLRRDQVAEFFANMPPCLIGMEACSGASAMGVLPASLAWTSSRQRALDLDKARDFWKTVVDHGAELSALLDASPTERGFQECLQRIGQVGQTLRDAATDIDPLLTVEVDQVPAGESAMLRIAISCNHDPGGIEAVQAPVAAAPAMPPRIRVCAFAQPTPREMARELASLEVLGREVPIQQVRFMAKPSTAAPGTFDVACSVPDSDVTELDPQGLPGALVADIMLSMGIGELRMMTRVSSMGVAVTDQPPPGALQAWDLVEIIDSARAH